MLKTHTWTHLAVSFDGAHIRFFVDGELVDTRSAEELPIGEGPLTIGGVEPFAEGGFFDGRIDELRIYERALDQAEVAADMESPLQTPKAGPVAEYSFDEDKGETVEDQAGENDGTVEGAEWTEHGRYGGAMKFDGEGMVTIPGAEDLDLTEEFTLEAWIRPEAGCDFGQIFVKEDAGEEHAAYVVSKHGSKLGAWLGVPGVEEESPSGTLEIGAWQHIAVTFNGSRATLYVDAEEVGSASVDEILSTSGDLRLGGSHIGSHGVGFVGRIDEVRIYSRSLNRGEVETDMETPIHTPRRGPVAAYSFDKESGESAEDISLNEHNGAVEGAHWTERGRYGGAYEFNGEAATCISVPNSESLQLHEELSVEAWVRPQGSNESEPIIVKESASSFSYALYLGKNNPGHIEGLIKGEGSEPSVTEDPENAEKDVWAQVDMTFDGAYLRLYVNGREVDKTKANGPHPSSGQLSIGCSKEFGESFTGRIDEVRLYNRALSEREIRERPETGLNECAAPNSRAASEPRTRLLPGGGTETSYQLGEGQMLYTATPPPSFDALTASAQELAKFGLPPKPSDPEMREEWETTWGGYQPIKPQPSTAPCETELNTESQPPVELEEEGEEGEEASSTGKLDHWSGFVGTNETELHHFTGVLGAYIQPSPSLFTPYQCPRPREVSWVGLGGYGVTPNGNPRGLIQAGTSIGSTSEPDYVWYEWLRGKPNHQKGTVKGSRKIIKDPAFNGYLTTNRLVSVYVTAGLDYGAEHGTSEHAGQEWALFQIRVEKSNGEMFGKPALIVPFNAKSFYNGETVEWIDERPGVGVENFPEDENAGLQDFGTIPWSEAYAYTGSSSAVPVGKLANKFRGVMKPGSHAMTKPSRIFGGTRFTDEWLRCRP